MKQHLTPSSLACAAFMAVAATALMLTACTETVNTHGQIMLPSKLAQVKVGESTRDDILGLFGTPSARGTLNDNRWYYVTSIEASTPLKPHILKQQDVYVVDFDTAGKVATFAKRTAEDGKPIDPADQATPTRGQSQGLVQQMFGNFSQMLGR